MTEMKKMDDGGAAFPAVGARGMSLRDFFAAHALVSMQIAGPYSESSRSRDYQQSVARTAYEYADAMLAARGA